MKFTKAEENKLFGERLNKFNTHKDGKYIARIQTDRKIRGKKQYKVGKKYETIEACNRAQEKMQKEYDNSRII